MSLKVLKATHPLNVLLTAECSTFSRTGDVPAAGGLRPWAFGEHAKFSVHRHWSGRVCHERDASQAIAQFATARRSDASHQWVSPSAKGYTTILRAG